MAASSRAIRAGKAFVELFVEDGKLRRGLKKAEWRLKTFGASVRRIGMWMAGIGGALQVPFLYAIKSAGSAIETVNKFEQVFGRQSEAAGKFADTLSKAIGRSRYEIRDTLASFHAFFLGFGFGQKQSRMLAQEIEKLTYDFASLYNIQDEVAFEKMQSALAGLPRTLRQYGVNILDSTVQQEALRMGLVRGTKELTGQQKVIARYSIIMRTFGKQGVIGDAVRTAHKFVNRMKALRGAVFDMSAAIGMALIPIVTKLVDKGVKIATIIGDWAAANKRVIVTVAKALAVVTGLGLVIMAVGTAFTLAGLALGGFSVFLGVVGAALGATLTVLGAMISPVGLITLAVTGLGVALLYTSGIGGEALDWLMAKFAVLWIAAKEAFGAIKNALLAGDISAAAGVMWTSLNLAWQTGTHGLEVMWNDFTFGFVSTFLDAAHGIETAWKTMVAKIGKIWKDFMAWYTETRTDLLADPGKTMAKAGRGIWGGMKAAGKWLAEGMATGVRTNIMWGGAAVKAIKQAYTGQGVTVKEGWGAIAAAADPHGFRWNRPGEPPSAGGAGDEEGGWYKTKKTDLQAKHDAKSLAAMAELMKARRASELAIIAANSAEPSTEPGAAAAIGKWLADLLESLKGGVQSSATARGTFSSAALWGMGGSSVAERTARAAELTATNTGAILTEGRTGGLRYL
ncbi:MAG TPA: hypothetical protein VMY35_19655 [Phycisphaerae bacterium]|nr:hypothetical protein [Phycisphaerae bacterium]